MRDMLQQFQYSGDEVQLKVLDMFHPPQWDTLEERLQLIADFNSHGISNSSSAGLFYHCSMLEHSCIPNVMGHSPDSRDMIIYELTALRDIVEGEFLTFNYLGREALTMPRDSRRSYLFAGKKFECACPRCEGFDIARPLFCSVLSENSCPGLVQKFGGSAEWVCGDCGKTYSEEDEKLNGVIYGDDGEKEFVTAVQSLSRIRETERMLDLGVRASEKVPRMHYFWPTYWDRLQELDQKALENKGMPASDVSPLLLHSAILDLESLAWTNTMRHLNDVAMLSSVTQSPGVLSSVRQIFSTPPSRDYAKARLVEILDAPPRPCLASLRSACRAGLSFEKCGEIELAAMLLCAYEHLAVKYLPTNGKDLVEVRRILKR